MFEDFLAKTNTEDAEDTPRRALQRHITFGRDGGANQNQQRGPTPAPVIDNALRNNFLKVAYPILMQPTPAPDQDRTTSGPTPRAVATIAIARSVLERQKETEVGTGTN